MKGKLLIIFIIILLTFAITELRASRDGMPLEEGIREKQTNEREVPLWSWEVEPQLLLENYYDYFQSYNESPITVHRCFDGGVSMVFRARNSMGESSVYYAYINDVGEVEAIDSLGYKGIYPDAHADEETSTLFTTWFTVDDGYSCEVLYDLYYATGLHNDWRFAPIEVIDPNNPGIFPHPDDEYTNPQIKTGPSPNGEKRRVYMTASNRAISTGGTGLPSGNYLFCYADFDGYDLLDESALDWHYSSIDELDGMHLEDPEWGRTYKSWLVIDNMIIIGGVLERDNMEDTELFFLVNNNYGEGEWEMHSSEWFFEVDEPGIDLWESFIHSTHFNLVPVAGNSKVMWGGSTGYFYSAGSGMYYYIPGEMMVYPTGYCFDLETEELSHVEVFAHDIDSGGPSRQQCWPIVSSEPDMAFHYNHYSMASNPEEGWVANVWTDGTNLTRAYYEEPGYEDWAGTPEIAIAFSETDGQSWYDPIYLNANPQSQNYCPELAGMVPCYVYAAEYIEPGEGDRAILHLLFIDDYSYGSYYCGYEGENLGAAYEYAAVSIEVTSGEDAGEIPADQVKCLNYPNPFNPSTTIEFELAQSGEIKLEIYNVKGQKLETLAKGYYQSGEHRIQWQAQGYPSGVYYYRIKGADYTGRMLLMK